MLRKILFTLGVIVMSLSSTSFALGLGEIRLNSNLNEPLDAEIILLSSRGETADQIIAKLGTTQDFRRSGIDRNYFLTRIQFESIRKSNGQLVIKATTANAPPRACEPTSPMNICAGWALNQRNAKQAPTTTKPKVTRNCCPCKKAIRA